MSIGLTGRKLAEKIKTVIEKHFITSTEYEEILQLAYADGVVDQYEQRALGELHHLIAVKAVTRVPG